MVIKSFPPGAFSFSIYGTGSDNLIKSFDINGIEAGKTYAVYFSGESSSTLEAHKVID